MKMNALRPSIFASTLAVVLVLSSVLSYGSTAVCTNPFQGVDGADSVSQLIRSNAAHYWTFAVKAAKSTEMRPFAKYEGIVVGDPHLGNFSVVPVRFASGRWAMKFVDIDFDDAGRGSFAMDFARLVITIKAADGDIKIKDVLEAYVSGLNGETIEAPKKVEKALDLTKAEFQELEDEFVDKKVRDGKFKLKEEKLEKYSAKYAKKSIVALFPGETVVDIATRPNERGGSADAVRIWVLVKDPSGGLRVDEIKGYETPAVAKFSAQPEIQTWYREVQSTLWQGLSDSEYKLVTLEGDPVWLRSKKVTLIDVPYGLSSAKKKEFVSDLSLFDANHLGLLHGAQASAKPYAAAISEDPDAFRAAIKTVTRPYLKKAEDKLED